ncbi:MAG: 50S ribosomal protein L23 [Saprospiraceae bacterium]|nr:50S ribosomal protein L23 [Saprospiraceae bacterium]
MAKDILVKPMVTEKSDLLSEKLNQYTFVVHKKANKVEIRKAVEEMYGVTVEAVNTATMPGKVKSRSTRTGVLKGRKPSYKKAIVTLSGGEEIDFFGDI